MSTAADLRAFAPVKPYFVAIDSDGTVFDSMTPKHRDAFIPAAIRIWGINGEAAGAFTDFWLHLNLHSPDRGINRFASLVKAFAFLRDRGNTVAPDPAPLGAFLESGAPLSAPSLAAYAAANPAPFLADVLRWSADSDVLFAAATANIQPFTAAPSAIEAMSQKADIMVLSSAAGAGLEADWSRCGLLKYTALCAGQEAGSKKEQLALAAAGKYGAHRILVIGDAPGDADAASSVGAAFYLIDAGNENDCWQKLEQEVLNGKRLA